MSLCLNDICEGELTPDQRNFEHLTNLLDSNRFEEVDRLGIDEDALLEIFRKNGARCESREELSRALERARGRFVWTPGFCLQLGSKGRKIMLQLLRVAYKSNKRNKRIFQCKNPPTTISNLPFFKINMLWELASDMGVFDEALLIHEFFGNLRRSGNTPRPNSPPNSLDQAFRTPAPIYSGILSDQYITNNYINHDQYLGTDHYLNSDQYLSNDQYITKEQFLSSINDSYIRSMGHGSISTGSMGGLVGRGLVAQAPVKGPLSRMVQPQLVHPEVANEGSEYVSGGYVGTNDGVYFTDVGIMASPSSISTEVPPNGEEEELFYPHVGAPHELTTCSSQSEEDSKHYVHSSFLVSE